MVNVCANVYTKSGAFSLPCVLCVCVFVSVHQLCVRVCAEKYFAAGAIKNLLTEMKNHGGKKISREGLF